MSEKVDLSRTAFVQCPKCPKTGTPRGIKHHYTSVHAEGVSGQLVIAYAAVSKADLARLRGHQEVAVAS